jgi:hypothetical protein
MKIVLVFNGWPLVKFIFYFILVACLSFWLLPFKP